MNHGNRLFLGDRKVGLNGPQAWLWITGWSWGCSAFDADLDGDQGLSPSMDTSLAPRWPTMNRILT